MTRVSRSVAGLATAAILLIAWVLYVRQPTRPPSVGDSPALALGGQLVATYRREPASFNRYVSAQASSELISRLTHDTLVRINRVTGEIEPRLAERWTVSDAGRVCTLTLRSGVTFSDDVPFTAADVLFSFKAAFGVKGSTLAAGLSVGNRPLEVSATDDRTVVIRYPSAFAPGLRILDGLPIYPRHKLEAAFDEGRFAEMWNTSTPPADLAGLGPFVVSEYVTGQRVVLTRNARFWRKDAAGVQLPYLDTLVIEIVPDQNGEVLRFQAGQVDLTTDEARPDDLAAFRRDAEAGGPALRPFETPQGRPEPVEGRQAQGTPSQPRGEGPHLRQEGPDLRRRASLVEVGVSLDPNLLWFNLNADAKAKDPRRAWLQSEAFRKAIAHAIDRARFVDTVYLGAGEPIYGPVTPGNHLWYAPDAPRYPHDVTRARELFEQAGLADRNGDGSLEDASGRAARFSIITQQGHTLRERGAAVIQEQLRRVGLLVDIVKLDPGGLFGRFMARDYDAIYFGVETSDFDPNALKEFWLSSGQYHFWNPTQAKPATEWEAQIDALMARQETTLDPGERKRLFADVQRIFGEHVPALYFAAPKIFVAVSPRVANAKPALMNPKVLWNAEELALRQTSPR